MNMPHEFGIKRNLKMSKKQLLIVGYCRASPTRSASNLTVFMEVCVGDPDQSGYVINFDIPRSGLEYVHHIEAHMEVKLNEYAVGHLQKRAGDAAARAHHVCGLLLEKLLLDLHSLQPHWKGTSTDIHTVPQATITGNEALLEHVIKAFDGAVETWCSCVRTI